METLGRQKSRRPFPFDSNPPKQFKQSQDLLAGGRLVILIELAT